MHGHPANRSDSLAARYRVVAVLPVAREGGGLLFPLERLPLMELLVTLVSPDVNLTLVYGLLDGTVAFVTV